MPGTATRLNEFTSAEAPQSLMVPAQTDLTTIDPARVREIVAALPSNKRPAMSKALKAACEHLRNSRRDYSKAFQLATSMVENEWHLGRELRSIERHKGGRPPKTPRTCEEFSLKELGINYSHSQRCQRLAELDWEELLTWINKQYDENKYTLPSLHPAACHARRQKTDTNKFPIISNTHPAVRHGDFREVLADVTDIDAIITDPPYGKEYLPLWSDLGKFAAERLKPNGVLIAYCGQYCQREAMNALAGYLDFWWTLSVVHAGQGNLTPFGRPVRVIINGWKPVLLFVQRGGAIVETVRDIIPSVKPDKHDHNWAQPVQEAEWLIRNFTLEGSLVVDPFAGGGTVGYACDVTGRCFEGAEILDVEGKRARLAPVERMERR